MSEDMKILYCDSCASRQNFIFGGSGKTGVCMECGHEVKDIHVPYLRLVAQLELKAEYTGQLWDYILEGMRRIKKLK